MTTTTTSTTSATTTTATAAASERYVCSDGQGRSSSAGIEDCVDNEWIVVAECRDGRYREVGDGAELCEDGVWRPTAVVPTTTTEPPRVPDEVQQAYLDAGQPELDYDEYVWITEMCENLLTRFRFQSLFWSDLRSHERELILTDIGPLCPEVGDVLDSVRPLPTFGGGTHVVDVDIEPGLYFAEANDCYWERLSGLSGEFDDVIANAFDDGQHIVEVLASDEAFRSDGCGRWSLYQAPTAPPATFGDGDWVVGEQIPPGRYRSSGAGLCYWERARGFTHEIGEVVANHFGDGPVIVEVRPGDARFSARGCGKWQPI